MRHTSIDCKGEVEVPASLTCSMDSAASNNVMGPNSSHQEQLETIRNIAELWMQADQECRGDRKTELEKVLEDALSRIRGAAAEPICVLFQTTLVHSRRKSGVSAR